jgi:hypothetical protein
VEAQSETPNAVKLIGLSANCDISSILWPGIVLLVGAGLLGAAIARHHRMKAASDRN